MFMWNVNNFYVVSRTLISVHWFYILLQNLTFSRENFGLASFMRRNVRCCLVKSNSTRIQLSAKFKTTAWRMLFPRSHGLHWYSLSYYCWLCWNWRWPPNTLRRLANSACYQLDDKWTTDSCNGNTGKVEIGAVGMWKILTIEPSNI